MASVAQSSLAVSTHDIDARTKVPVMIVDDHPIVRTALVTLISAQPDMVICSEAGDPGELLNKISQANPAVLVLDYTLPGRSGIELIKDIAFFAPHVRILVLSMHDEYLFAERALRAGASGYIMKSAGSDAIVAAIRQIVATGVYLSSGLSTRLLRSLTHATPSGERTPVSVLSDREFEIFMLFGKGLEASAVASELRISRKTVDVHRANIRKKLSLPSSAALICYAAQWAEDRKEPASSS